MLPQALAAAPDLPTGIYNWADDSVHLPRAFVPPWVGIEAVLLRPPPWVWSGGPHTEYRGRGGQVGSVNCNGSHQQDPHHQVRDVTALTSRILALSSLAMST